MSGLIGGLLYPLTMPTHVLALLALGLLIGRQRGSDMPWSAAVFVAGLALGLAAIAFAARPTFAGDVLLGTAALAGALVALGRLLPMPACALLAGIAGTALGLDSPPHAISLAVATLMLIGTGLGAGLALALIAAGARCMTREWQRIGVRILGSWIAASAVLALALRFARGQLS
jgi:urease accessory protein